MVYCDVNDGIPRTYCLFFLDTTVGKVPRLGLQLKIMTPMNVQRGIIVLLKRLSRISAPRELTLTLPSSRLKVNVQTAQLVSQV
jgi:hypothetical protein